jgi:eukaryotic-like serine/threonine-protein kinase
MLDQMIRHGVNSRLQLLATRSGGPPGSSIGPYRFLDVNGEGGLGVVWLAERREPMVHRVALKIIKPGMDSKAVALRFEQERRAQSFDEPSIRFTSDVHPV